MSQIYETGIAGVNRRLNARCGVTRRLQNQRLSLGLQRSGKFRVDYREALDSGDLSKYRICTDKIIDQLLIPQL